MANRAKPVGPTRRRLSPAMAMATLPTDARRTPARHANPRTRAVSPAHFSLRRSDRIEVRAEGSRARVVGIFEAAIERVETRRPGTARLSHESQLSPGVHARTDRVGLSRRRLVSL